MASQRQLIQSVWRDTRQNLTRRGGSWLPSQPKMLAIPKVLPGEVFSSWMVRGAALCRMPLRQFKAVWKIRSALHWIDSGITHLQAEAIAARASKVDANDLEASRWSSRSYFACWHGLCLTTSPLNCRPIYRYCPECLRNDEIPYYRKAWRLTFNYVCTEHGLLLQEKCPVCDQEIDIEQQRNVAVNERPAMTMRYCQRCGAELCAVRLQKLSAAQLDILVAAQFRMQILTYDVSKIRLDNFDCDEYFASSWTPFFLDHIGWQMIQRRELGAYSQSSKALDSYILRIYSKNTKSPCVVPAGINGVRLFGERAKDIQRLFQRRGRFGSTYWIPEGKLATASLYQITSAIHWLNTRTL